MRACLSAALGLFVGSCGEAGQDAGEIPLDEAGDPRDVAPTPPDAAAPTAKRPRFVPLQAIVKFREGDAPRAAKALAHVAKRESLPRQAQLLHLERAGVAAQQSDDEATSRWIDELRARLDVEYAHPNWIFELSRVPSGPVYPRQWHYPALQLPAAWDLTTGHAATRIAILDTGRTGHPDLAGAWVPGLEYDARDQDGDARTGDDEVWRHGVHVAGIAAGPNGVCWGCELLNVKVTWHGELTADLASVARAVPWAVDNGARVINMSFEANGLPCADPSWEALRGAFQYASARNVVLVAAAGNQGTTAANTVPASCADVISVAATDRNNALAAYSNRGPVTLAAPGGAGSLVRDPVDGGWVIRPEDLGSPLNCPADANSSFGPSDAGAFSTWTTSYASGSAHCYRYLSGTSMAAPHVAGVVGLMLSRNPTLTPAQVRQHLVQSAQPLPSCGGSCGAGLVNASAAVQRAAPLPVADAAPVARFTMSCAGLQCTFNGSQSTDDRGLVAYQWILPGRQLRDGSTTSFFMPGYSPQTVRLRVTDTSGQSSELSRVLTPPITQNTGVLGVFHNPQRPGNHLEFYDTPTGERVLVWFTYETDGRPVWYTSAVAPAQGTRWSANLTRYTWNGSSAVPASVGSVALDFSDPTTAWFSWVLRGVPGGERFVFRSGGMGRTGAWYMPSQPGWGIHVQEEPGSPGALGATLTIYNTSESNHPPIWLTGTAASSPNATIPLRYFNGYGLCPSCGGSAPAIENISWSGSINLKIENGLVGLGESSTDVNFFNPPLQSIWRRTLRPIAILTRP